MNRNNQFVNLQQLQIFFVVGFILILIFMVSCVGNKQNIVNSHEINFLSSDILIADINELFRVNRRIYDIKKFMFMDGKNLYASQVEQMIFNGCSEVIDAKNYQAHLKVLENSLTLELHVKKNELNTLNNLLNKKTIPLIILPSVEKIETTLENDSFKCKWPSSDYLLNDLQKLIDLYNEIQIKRVFLTRDNVLFEAQVNQAVFHACSELIDVKSYQIHLKELENSIKLELEVKLAALESLAKLFHDYLQGDR